MRIVEQVGIAVSYDTDNEGHYKITAWAKIQDGGFGATQVYNRLSWYEAVDVVNAVMADLRPGRDLDPDGEALPLW